jgi:imidazolonepropionase-like amidohydrolase
MPHHLRSIKYLIPLLLFALPAAGQEDPVAFVGATLHPISGPVIENGVLVVHGGRIVAAGTRAAVRIPANAEVRNVEGRAIMPGLVDTHSHVGGVQGGDASSPLHPDVRTLDALDVRARSLDRARAGGITTANVMSGSGHLLSGQTTYLKLRRGRVIDDLLFCADPIRDICGGIKMANGTNSLRGGGGTFPGTRARSAALVRQLFVDAREYRDKTRGAEENGGDPPRRDLRLEALEEVLDGRRIVHFHTHRHDDILTVLRLAEEFGFRVVLHHVSEAWKVADEIAAAGVPSSIIVLDSPGGKLEAARIGYENGAALERAGADVAFHTDDFVTDSRLFLRMAAFGVRGGMSREKALEAVTLAGARMLDLQDRIGSLEPGKDADFILLSGDPLSVYTRVLETWIEGAKVWDFADAEHRIYATGGYGAYGEPFFDHHEGLHE